MTKAHLIGQVIKERYRQKADRERCTCEWVGDVLDGLEYIEWIDPGCPIHETDYERLHPLESNQAQDG